MNKYKGKILIVDDLPKNIQIVGSILKNEGYNISYALNGDKALDLCRNNRYDLILIDVMMPGLNGYDTCRKLKKQEILNTIPIILMLTKSTPEEINKAFRAQANDYIAKPVNSLELTTRINNYIDFYKKQNKN